MINLKDVENNIERFILNQAGSMLGLSSRFFTLAELRFEKDITYEGEIKITNLFIEAFIDLNDVGKNSCKLSYKRIGNKNSVVCDYDVPTWLTKLGRKANDDINRLYNLVTKAILGGGSEQAIIPLLTNIYRLLGDDEDLLTRVLERVLKEEYGDSLNILLKKVIIELRKELEDES